MKQAYQTKNRIRSQYQEGVKLMMTELNFLNSDWNVLAFQNQEGRQRRDYLAKKKSDLRLGIAKTIREKEENHAITIEKIGDTEKKFEYKLCSIYCDESSELTATYCYKGTKQLTRTGLHRNISIKKNNGNSYIDTKTQNKFKKKGFQVSQKSIRDLEKILMIKK